MTIPNENQDACFPSTQRVVTVFLSRGLRDMQLTGGLMRADVGALSYRVGFDADEITVEG
jgi:hypothetical protein